MCKLKESAYTKSTANILAWNHVYPKLNNSQDAIRLETSSCFGYK